MFGASAGAWIVFRDHCCVEVRRARFNVLRAGAFAVDSVIFFVGSTRRSNVGKPRCIFPDLSSNLDRGMLNLTTSDVVNLIHLKMHDVVILRCIYVHILFYVLAGTRRLADHLAVPPPI
eukprot:9051304-Pyramimonas_sp.AAC.1